MIEYCQIELTKGLIAKVSPVDFLRVSSINWFASQVGPYWFAARNNPMVNGVRRGKTTMHRWLLAAPEGMVVDHINGDTLDNRRENLRIATPSENKRNRKMASTNRCGVKGIYWNKSAKKWIARIGINGRKIDLGRFNSKEAAAQAYKTAAPIVHGEFARLV